MFDPDSVFEKVSQHLVEELSKRGRPAIVRLWDGDWNQIAEVVVRYGHDFEIERLEAGSATLEIPLTSDVARFMMDPEQWPTKSIYLTSDKDGVRWSGRLEGSTVEVDYTGDQHLKMVFLHDYAKLKELLVWANPFLPAEVQFPKSWMLFGPARWVVATTLFVNLLRKNTSLWMVPDDPMNLGQWFDLDMSNWNMVVKPLPLELDTSLPAIVESRFKYFHDCVKDVCKDAQLTIECRRWLEGDPPPWEGANLRHGCLVFEVVDKSGWNKATSFGGDARNGLAYAIKMITGDGTTEGLEYIPRVNNPDEYYKPGFLGSLPEAPWVVLEHGERTGMVSSKFEYVPPGPSQFVVGGSSMPFVNEGIKAAIIGVGGVIGSIFGQSQAGTVAESLLEPLYSDVFLAFMAHKQHDRIAEQGWDYPFEHWVDGADRAYTLGAISAIRKAKHDTRERYSVEVEMVNGAPYYVGDRGHGDFYIGDRVAVHALGMPKDRLFVEQVEKLSYSEDSDEGKWTIGIGNPEFGSGIEYMGRLLDSARSGLRDMGVW